MKITDTGNIAQAILQKSGKKSGPVSKDFNQFLDENIGKLSALNADSTKPLSVSKTSPVFFAPTVDRQEVVSRVIKFLDIMEEYAGKLNSPGVSLKEIDPLVAIIETKKNDLQGLSQSLSPSDELKTILDETLIRSSVEVIKFNRGDYI